MFKTDTRQNNCLAFIKKASKKFDNKFNYKYACKDYTTQKGSEVRVICPYHSEFKIFPDSHLQSNYGCNRCGNNAKAEKNRQEGKKRFLKTFKDKHGKKIKLLSEYADYETPVQCYCKIHKIKFAKSPVLINSCINPCEQCYKEEASRRQMRSPKESLALCLEKHGQTYDYSKALFGSGHQKIDIICPLSLHGSFMQRLDAHIGGQGCPKCGVQKTTIALTMSQDDWLDRAIEAHDDRYDYSKVNYKNWDEKVEIICPLHDIFHQRAGDHIKGKGCRLCGFLKISKAKRWNTEKWIAKAQSVHGDLYDYSLANYQGSWELVDIICSVHGLFPQKAAVHSTMGSGCPKCGRIKMAESLSYTTEEAIRMAKDIHGTEKYDYSEFVYYPRKNEKQKKSTIICKKHESFLQTAKDHISGKGCTKCKIEKIKEILTWSNKQYIAKARKIHKNLYDYNNLDYRGMKEKVSITCSIHGLFWQSAEGHLDGNGCQRCRHSKGELAVAEFLESQDIEFEVEKRFKDCKRKYRLPFDFYMPSIPALIEFDGEQHFKPARWTKDKSRALQRLQYVQENDVIKNDWAKTNNIPLFRIRYDEDINEALEKIYSALGKNN